MRLAKAHREIFKRTVRANLRTHGRRQVGHIAHFDFVFTTAKAEPKLQHRIVHLTSALIAAARSRGDRGAHGEKQLREFSTR